MMAAPANVMLKPITSKAGAARSADLEVQLKLQLPSYEEDQRYQR